MNTAHLKNYAPRARKDFIAAVTARAAKFGITAKHIQPIVEQGDVALIGDKAYPRPVAENRRKLEARIEQQGFARVMEAMAYTWFNRFMAIRYMELHGYLDHGRRVLSHPEKQRAFEILEACTDVELPGVDKDLVVELKLDGSKDEELYRLLLLGQCHALHQAMPFLFEAIEDDSELLLPDNLTKTDSLIRHLVDDIPEDNWDNIEIIGWLYQFYISEKKDQVIGKVVKSEDIPAATQLFTPNWIVKYMVQNSLGAQWLATYPDSKLKGQMEYYIEPAEQTDEVKAQLAAITPSQLNPEELTLIDPACGSGHILVEAYELFKAIYLERGYRKRDVPQLILEKNLFGLDIDERAAQLAGFALIMKGRADDRWLFERGVKLNVMALVDSAGFDSEGLAKGVKLADYGLSPSDLAGLKRLFEHATAFGSLIQVPVALAKKLPALKQLSEAISQDLFVSASLKRLGALVQQAETLATQYHAVVANPPYMGSGYFCASLKEFVNAVYKPGKADLYGAFLLRNVVLAGDTGRIGMITIPNWMSLSAYKNLRSAICRDAPILSLVHNGRGVWGADFGSCSFVLQRSAPEAIRGTFLRLFTEHSKVASNDEIVRRFFDEPRFSCSNANFAKIPGNPIAYWASAQVYTTFDREKLSEIADPRIGIQSGDNEKHYRQWFEVSSTNRALNVSEWSETNTPRRCWVPLQQGGDRRKWYGNNEAVVNLQNCGSDILSTHNASMRNQALYFRESVVWNRVSNGRFFVRQASSGYAFDDVSPFAQPKNSESLSSVLGLLGSNTVRHLLHFISTGMKTEVGHVAALPLPQKTNSEGEVEEIVRCLVDAGKADWDAYERSWDFQSLPLLTTSSGPTPNLESSYTAWITQNRDTVDEMQRLEEENNRVFIEAYGLQDELTPDVPIEQITLTVNPAYRYGGKLAEEEVWPRFRQDTMKELVSYAIGCMMGRYSLDAPGLIYAHSGNEGFDPSRYPTFPADSDGIVPITDTDWFPDDAAHRVFEFISVAWDKSHLEANLTFLADNLSPKKNEASQETIRRYLCDSFFKDHLQTYKKRPIYWLFSSGKQKAFQCLVYLHRYNKGTLARMRTEYVIPLQGKMSSRIDQLDSDIAATSSTAHRKKLEKERDKLAKQRVELQGFDEKLRHYADQRISLDLDDGVKVNYGKFGDLLAEVKAITGTKATLWT